MPTNTHAQVHRMISPIASNNVQMECTYLENQNFVQASVNEKLQCWERKAALTLSELASDLFPSNTARIERLTRTEQRIENLINRRRIELLEEIADTRHGLKSRRQLRVWPTTTIISNGAKADDVWVLRVEGCLLDHSELLHKQPKSTPSRHKFTSFFESIALELVGMPGTNVFEWSCGQSGPSQLGHGSQIQQKRQEMDGIELRGRVAPLVAHGQMNIQYRLHMMRRLGRDGNSSLSSRFILAPSLRKILPGAPEEVLYDEAISAVREYIIVNNLVDVQDRSIVICDQNLQELFKCTSFHFSSLNAYLQEHLLSLMPHIFEGTINLDASCPHTDSYFDIEVDIDAAPIDSRVNCLRELENLLHKTNEDTLLCRAEYLTRAINTRCASFSLLKNFWDSTPESIERFYQSFSSDKSILAASALEKVADKSWSESVIRTVAQG